MKTGYQRRALGWVATWTQAGRLEVARWEKARSPTLFTLRANGREVTLAESAARELVALLQLGLLPSAVVGDAGDGRRRSSVSSWSGSACNCAECVATYGVRGD